MRARLGVDGFEELLVKIPRTGAGLDLVQHDQHGEFCLCPDPNEAPPPRAVTCTALRIDVIAHALAIEEEAATCILDALHRRLGDSPIWRTVQPIIEEWAK